MELRIRSGIVAYSVIEGEFQQKICRGRPLFYPLSEAEVRGQY